LGGQERSIQTGADKNILDIAQRCDGVNGDSCLCWRDYVFSAA